MTNPLISVVIPVYNTEKYVAEAIESIQNQTFTDWELILVDDCSADSSVEVCMSYAEQDSRIRVIRQEQNQGALKSRNLGIEAATGRFLCFLDSDDTFEPEKLETQVTYMLQNDLAVSFTRFQRITEEGEFMGGGNVLFKPEVSYQDLLGNPLFSIITLMIDREKVQPPLVKQHLQKAEDYVFHLHILKQGVKAFGIDRALSNYRYRPGSQSTSFFGNSADMWKVLYQVENLPLPQSAFYFLKYLYKGVGKRLILFKQLKGQFK
ncbi:glycosyltransferase family 2 protein [Algoriphagus namhaensis]